METTERFSADREADETSEAEKITLEEFLELRPNEILELVEADPENPDVDDIIRIRSLSYELGYKFIAKEHGKNETMLKELQERIDETILSWTEEILKEMDLAEKIKADIAERDKDLSVLKVVRGMRCNYNCKFCLEQTTDEEQKNYVDEFAEISYTKEKLFLAMLYSRLAFGIKRINFSGGDPLVNKPKQLTEEIAMAKELGFSKITILTNGALLNKDLIDSYSDAGLTNLSVSLHTKDTNEYNELTRPKSKKDYHGHIKEMVKYAAQKSDLTVRINAAKTKDYTEDVGELITFAKELGVQEVTINEMIPANEFSKEQHEKIPNEIAGYIKKQELHWGLSLYKASDGQGPSVAICRFGGEDFANTQSKDLYLLPNGTLSQYLFDRGKGIDY